MRKFSAAEISLVIGVAGGILLLLFGETKSAVILFAVEALGWAAVYAVTTPNDE